jgi:hypothetical protein
MSLGNLTNASLPSWYIPWNTIFSRSLSTEFSTYNDLFSIVKHLEESLPAVVSRAKEAMACVIQLRPEHIPEVSASPSRGTTQTTRAYAIGDLDNKPAAMAMLRALPHEYGNFTSSLMRQKNLTRANIEAAFLVKQTECNPHNSPLLFPSGDAALRTTAQPPRQNKPGIRCGFCTSEGHNEDACYKKDRAHKDVQKAVKECHANRNSANPYCANCAAATSHAAAASPSSPAPSDSAKVTELAASASVRLGGSPNTHADTHWIVDRGATSHMSPRCSWFPKLDPLAIPIRVANNHVLYSEGVGSVVLELADK